MPPTFILRYSFFFFFLVFFFLFFSGILAQSSPSFGFNFFAKKFKSLDSHIALLGDAKLDENGSFVQITQSWSYSAGRLMYRKPIKQFGGNGNKNGKGKYSFGTYFSFSLSSENGDGLIFVMLPNGFSSNGYNGKLFGLSNEIIQKKNRAFFAVEIDTKTDTEFGDLNNNHIGINVGSLVSIKVKNASDVRLGLNSGQKLQCWIDYEASSKRIEVRMSKFGEERPVSPLLSCPIDLSEMLRSKEIYIGLSSSNANSTQVCKLYSWSFELRQVPYWMHSQPLDPQTFSKDAKPVAIRRRSDCTLKVLMALIIGTVCGALGAYIVMFVWSVLFAKQPIAPEEYVVEKPVIYDSEKVKVVAFDMFDDGKKLSCTDMGTDTSSNLGTGTTNAKI